MDGENNGKPYVLMDDFGGTTIFGNIHMCIFWLVVEPTPLKNMLVKMGSSSPKFEVNIKKIFELQPPSIYMCIIVYIYIYTCIPTPSNLDTWMV